MKIIARFLIAFVALEHLAFMILEMYFWTKPLGLKIFGNSAEVAETSAILASNQGLYNGFLAGGLVWSLLIKDNCHSRSTSLFFLSCVVLAGLFGGLTAKGSIFFIQGLPALLAIPPLLLSARHKPDNERLIS